MGTRSKGTSLDAAPLYAESKSAWVTLPWLASPPIFVAAMRTVEEALHSGELTPYFFTSATGDAGVGAGVGLAAAAGVVGAPPPPDEAPESVTRGLAAAGPAGVGAPDEVAEPPQPASPTEAARARPMIART